MQNREAVKYWFTHFPQAVRPRSTRSPARPFPFRTHRRPLRSTRGSSEPANRPLIKYDRTVSEQGVVCSKGWASIGSMKMGEFRWFLHILHFYEGSDEWIATIDCTITRQCCVFWVNRRVITRGKDESAHVTLREYYLHAQAPAKIPFIDRLGIMTKILISKTNSMRWNGRRFRYTNIKKKKNNKFSK